MYPLFGCTSIRHVRASVSILWKQEREFTLRGPLHKDESFLILGAEELLWYRSI
jgi:hypothetical protein